MSTIRDCGGDFPDRERKRRGLRRETWLDFAAYCQIPEKAASRLLNEQIEALAASLELIHASLLPDDLRRAYAEIIRENTDILSP